MGAAVVLKLILWVLCRRYAAISPAADALAQALHGSPPPQRALGTQCNYLVLAMTLSLPAC
jgi:hypothetical protein